MKKVVVLSALLFLGIVIFFNIYRRKNSERIECGTDMDILKRRFENINGINQCYYETMVIGRTGLGPTNYQLEAIIFIENGENNKIERQYTWKDRQVNVSDVFLKKINVDNDIVWKHNALYEEMVLNGKFIGEVYFSSDNNLVYLLVENL